MARLQNPMLFFTTSPRTPHKMIPEIKLLIKHLSGQKWDRESQRQYAQLLAEENFFNGSCSSENMDFSARDRINRAPKALGFVDLKPTIQLTEAGHILLKSKRPEEIFLRQMLKFQIPSPYHKAPKEFEDIFCVRPYLEMLRVIYELGAVRFDELMIFGLQLTHYRKFNGIISEISYFRKLKASDRGSYHKFRNEYLENEIAKIFQESIKSGNTKTRESNDVSIHNFLKTKARTMRDYTDACFRYLRATGLIEVSQRGHSISILPEKRKEVEFLLSTVDRNPIYTENEIKFKEYLFDSGTPVLYTDDSKRIKKQIATISNQKYDFSGKTTEDLKDILDNEIQRKKDEIINTQLVSLKKYRDYSDVIDMFTDIKKKALYDTPLMLEWNTWRSMVMLDGGNIRANLKLDDYGQPMSVAQGNVADIICDYGDFFLTVEVTMQSGHRQFEIEGESVARHLAKLKKETGKEAYCLFIAPKINPSCIAYFYSLHKINIAFYGGFSVIVPVELDIFINMLEQSYTADYVPDPNHLKKFFQNSLEQARQSADETEWYGKIKETALNWL